MVENVVVEGAVDENTVSESTVNDSSASASAVDESRGSACILGGGEHSAAEESGVSSVRGLDRSTAGSIRIQS